MQKKTCPNGHVYDPEIYGDQCPLCPAPSSPHTSGDNFPNQAGGPATQFGPMTGQFTAPAAGAHTQVAAPAPAIGGYQNPAPTGPAGKTVARPASAEPQPQSGAHTVIRRPGQPITGQSETIPARKLVGFLVSYNKDPMGKSYNLYEGRNFIGRDQSCDICVADDTQMSGRHMSILYRGVDGKFKFRDEQSSNGTFINKELLDDGELQNYDIIRAGSTLFIFIAIPKIG